MVLAPALALVALACSNTASTTPATTTSPPATTSTSPATATREILGRFPAPEAPGYDQYLLRVTIPPGVELPAHHHPGMEVARIDQGALTYTILEGRAPIGRDGAEGPTEEVAAPAEVVLHAGDTVYEMSSMHHRAANRGGVPVVVLLASLIEVGQPITVND